MSVSGGGWTGTRWVRGSAAWDSSVREGVGCQSYWHTRAVMSSSAGDSGRASESSEGPRHEGSDAEDSAEERSEIEGESSDDRSMASTSEAGSSDFEDIQDASDSMEVDFITDDDCSDTEYL